MLNIVEAIFSRADPKALAIIAGEQCLTFGELETLTAAAALQLQITHGQRIGLYCPNGIAHIVWSLAILKCGGILVPIAPELSPVERDIVVRSTALSAILCADGNKWHRDETETREFETPGLKPARLLRGARDLSPEFDEAALTALNPALIRFSSGTTGKRKGIILSHETLLARVTAANAGLQIGPGDRVIWMLPMAHHFAVSIVLYLLHGATTVLVDSHLGEDVFSALNQNGGTVLYASPFHYGLLASCESAKPVGSLRLAVSTAASLPANIAANFLERFSVPLTQALGIIEVGLPIFNDAWAREKPGSIGRPQPGYAIAIRNEEGSEVPAGTVGSLFIRGPGIADAYLQPWTPQEKILEAGWFRSGDLAQADAEGAVFLAGRTFSVINVGGLKCFPEEVEATLNEYPGILESRVLAQPHPALGMMPVAEIVPREASAPPKTSDLLAFCRARLSNYKIPLRFNFVTAIPKTPTGKIQR